MIMASLARGGFIGASWRRAAGIALGSVLCAAPVSAQVAPECGGVLPAAAKLPDLMNMYPTHVHVQEQDKHDRLMFTVGLTNVGQGPLELAPESSLTDPSELVNANQNVYDGGTNATGSLLCRRSLHDAFVFHPEHHHWHLVGVNGFEVRPALDDGTGGSWDTSRIIGSAFKESFCLLDYIKMDDEQLAAFALALPPREYFDCFGTHGISVGWFDTYHHATHGQYIDITGAPAGIYYLVVTANPDKLFLETDYTNNRSWVSFRLEYNGDNNAIATDLYNSFDTAGEGVRPPSASLCREVCGSDRGETSRLRGKS